MTIRVSTVTAKVKSCCANEIENFSQVAAKKRVSVSVSKHVEPGINVTQHDQAFVHYLGAKLILNAPCIWHQLFLVPDVTTHNPKCLRTTVPMCPDSRTPSILPFTLTDLMYSINPMDILQYIIHDE